MIEEDNFRGYYEPGFLHLRVQTDEDLSDLNRFLNSEEHRPLISVFLHEYIHFLQDISTTSGLMSAYLIIERIKEINSIIRESGDAQFNVPIRVTNKFNVQANDNLHRIYRGDSKSEDYMKYSSYLTEFESIVDKDGQVISVKKFKVFYYTRTGQSKYLQFGFLSLKEYVAHVIQTRLDVTVDHPDYPYRLPELIIEKEYPTFGIDPLNIAALCDACLMFTHPAQLFFGTIERMKTENFIPATVQEIYDFTFKGLLLGGPMGQFNITTLFNHQMNIVRGQLTDALASDIFSANRVWMNYILSAAENLRLTEPAFLMQLVTDRGQLSVVFHKVVKLLGTPFFTNSTGSGWHIPPEGFEGVPVQAYQLLVFKQIINVYQGENSCSLYRFCKSRPDVDITNELCLTAPWLRAEEDELCPFGQFWKTWGLLGKYPAS